MSTEEYSAILGLTGTLLLAFEPVRLEIFRFRSRKIDNYRAVNPVLAKLLDEAKSIQPALVIAPWSLFDSIIVTLGILLLAASYMVQLVM